MVKEQTHQILILILIPSKISNLKISLVTK